MNLVKIHKLTKNIFFNFVYIKVVVITAENYTRAGVHTIKELFWVKMIDVQRGLVLKSMPDLVRKEIQGIYETKKSTEDQNRQHIRTEQEITKKYTDDSKFKYARSDLMEKIIKNFKGAKTVMTI